MKKALAAAALLAALGAALWLRPGGVAATADDYPLEVGLRWTYRGGVVRRIERTVEVDGLRHFEMIYELPLLGRRTLLMRRTPEGVSTAGGALLLRLPMRVGDGWTIDVPGEKELADCRVLGEEEIEFAGRKAMATKLEVKRRPRGGGGTSTDYEWYAPGVGLVKMDVGLGVRATFTLASFGR